MKRTASILLVSSLLLAWAQPFMPYLEYAVFKDYIAVTLCINRDEVDLDCAGKCYRDRQLASISSESSTDKEAIPPLFNELTRLPQYLPGRMEPILHPSTDHMSLHSSASVKSLRQQCFATILAPPPKA